MMSIDQSEQKNAPQLKLFARAPVAGRAKTRLAARLGVEKTAIVAAGLIRETVALSVANWPGDVELTVWPTVDHAVFESLAQVHCVQVVRQSEGDLGDKMLDALHRGLASGSPTAVMGCDAPHCTAQSLQAAAQALSRGTNVYGPAEDGGFWFLGLTTPAPGLFDGIDWEGPNTGPQTLAGAGRVGITLTENLPLLFDIDTIEDFERLCDEHPELGARICPTDDGVEQD